jgi:hypothetical protein
MHHQGQRVVDAVEPYQRTSAARYNTAQRAEYASGLTDVPSASTRIRPVSGYLINDSAEPDQLRGLPDGHRAWSRCVASGGALTLAATLSRSNLR